MPLPQLRIERVVSEEIEGPSDFTLNLEKWMNGGTFGKSTVKDAKHVLENLREQDVNVGKDAQNSAVKLHEDRTTDSRHTPENTPPRTASSWSVPKPMDEQMAEGPHQGELDSSNWESYSHESTPQPLLQLQLHQPTVEDYYSEMTPARQLSTSRHSSTDAEHTSPTLVRRRSSVHSEPSSVGRNLSRATSPIPSQTAKERSSLRSDLRLESQLQLMQERCRHLQDLSTALNLTLDEERKSRKQEEAAYKDSMAKASQREQDLVTADKANAEALSQVKQWRSRLEDQEDEAKELSKRVRQQEEQVRSLQEKHAAETRELRQRLEEQQRDHAEQLHKLQNQDRKQSTEAKDPADESQRLRIELNRLHNRHSSEGPHLQADMDPAYHNHNTTEALTENNYKESRNSDEAELVRMQLELETAHDMSTEVEELREQLHKATTETQKIKSEWEAGQNRMRAVEAELKRMNSTKIDEVARTTGEMQRSRKLVETLQQQTKDLQQQLHDQRATYEAEAELKRLEEPEIDSEAPLLRDEINAKQTALNTALLERDALQDSLQGTRTELANLSTTNASLRSELADSEAALASARTALSEAEVVNAAFDAKISNAICKREKYWRERLEKSAEERKLMVKQLMHLWGQDEVGKARPQRFEYKFVQAGKGQGGKVAAS